MKWSNERPKKRPIDFEKGFIGIFEQTTLKPHLNLYIGDGMHIHISMLKCVLTFIYIQNVLCSTFTRNSAERKTKIDRF